jgi:hypothetical protein
MVVAVDARRIGNFGGFIPVPLLMLFIDRTRGLNQRFRRLAERIQAGWVYVPKPAVPRPVKAPAKPADAKPADAKPADAKADPPQPKPPSPFPTGFNWLRRLAPGQDTDKIAFGLYEWLALPDVAAVLAAAPGPAWRILSPLCRMMGVERPASLVLPPRPRKPRKAKRRKARKARKAPKRARPRRARGTIGPLHPYTADFPDGIPDKLLPAHLRKKAR